MGDGRPVQFLFPDQPGQLFRMCAELPNHLVVMLDPLFIVGFHRGHIRSLAVSPGEIILKPHAGVRAHVLVHQFQHVPGLQNRCDLFIR